MFPIIPSMSWGTQWHSWLRLCATSWKVVGSIPDSVTEIFHWHNPSGRTVALRLTQPLTEMSTRNISWGWRQPVCRVDNVTAFMCWLSWNLGASTSWNPQGLSRRVIGLLYVTVDVVVLFTSWCTGSSLAGPPFRQALLSLYLFSWIKTNTTCFCKICFPEMTNETLTCMGSSAFIPNGWFQFLICKWKSICWPMFLLLFCLWLHFSCICWVSHLDISICWVSHLYISICWESQLDISGLCGKVHHVSHEKHWRLY
jgi:hypothetical protein